ncbi:Bcr/CflA family efflux MFS transporter [Sphingomonas ginkgonis]|uniref:Bcr/CflA family efflux transporter n=1 Tax=Sphingomonas ginkgonis TaxID=2315330 RepID=A0A3R9YML5_9SPHN|nr:multidrug effflux MFS transporter [Sphingomonas ginkgonis]RST31209.1 Bcr/CflA family efflux MFS transporter [Sphingomonas ginkgonis]
MPIDFNHLPGDGPRPGAREAIAMFAGLMALNAVAMDIMVPALPEIARGLRIANENDRQLVVIAYLLGFGSTQLLWGPLADRLGRKPILAVGVFFYSLFAVGCAMATSFPLLVASRFAMGMAAATTRVLVVAMVRDLFEREAMARVMSLVFMTFMLVPVVAPNLGQLILAFASWRAIFLIMAGYGMLMLLWSWFRLPETLHPEYRRSLHPAEIGAGIRGALGERQSLGYTLALTALSGSLTLYIATVQQIVYDVFRAPHLIGLVFAAVAIPMAIASFLNSRLVGRAGLRRVGHSGLILYLAISLVHLGVVLAGAEGLPLFVLLQGASFFAFAFTSANFGSLAMEHMGPIAGTASSVQGVISTVGGAVIGLIAGRQFDGTLVPFVASVALCSLVAAALVLLTDRRQLFAGKQSTEAGLPA